MGHEDMFIAWAKTQKKLIALCIAFVLSFSLNIWQWQRYRSVRFYYESAMIAWAKAAGGVRSQEELNQLVQAVRESKPEKLTHENELVDFGFFKDSSGTWKVSR